VQTIEVLSKLVDSPCKWVSKETRMDVIIGNLPGNATLAELHDLVGEFDLRADFQCSKGHDHNGSPYHFFIARTATRGQGMELIARLNGLAFQGSALSARECVRRRQTGNWEQEERRVNPW
jgi:hypothetical protein